MSISKKIIFYIIGTIIVLLFCVGPFALLHGQNRLRQIPEISVLPSGAGVLIVTPTPDSPNDGFNGQIRLYLVDPVQAGLRVVAPNTSSDPCVAGVWASDMNYYYACVTQNTWKRLPLQSW